MRHTTSVALRSGQASFGLTLAHRQAFTISGRRLVMKYEKPAVQRFGTVREITLGAGPNQPGDATNLYHRS